MTDEKPPAHEPAGESAGDAESGGSTGEAGVAASAPSGENPSGETPSGDIPQTAARDTVTVRRSPRYGRFIILGAGVGAVVTFVLTNLFPTDPEVGFGPLFGYFLLFGVPGGAALGGLLAVVLDAISSRRATQLEAERSTVEAPDEELEGDLED